MKILISGISGSGKTTLAKKLFDELSKMYLCEHINADEVRAETNNWDFSLAGRISQTNELTKRANQSTAKIIICDFIAPTNQIREIFNPDYSIWLNTKKSSQYPDTDNLFEPFENANYIVDDFNSNYVQEILSDILTKISK